MRLTRYWCIPKADAAYVARMEDVLDVYSFRYDPKYPTVCLDKTNKETNKQLIKDVTPPLPMTPATDEKTGN